MQYVACVLTVGLLHGKLQKYSIIFKKTKGRPIEAIKSSVLLRPRYRILILSQGAVVHVLSFYCKYPFHLFVILFIDYSLMHPICNST